MLLGISSYTFPWKLSLEKDTPGKLKAAKDLIHFAAKKSIGFVQFGDNLPLHIFSEDDLDILKQTADDLNVHIEVGTRKLEHGNILKYLDIAKQLSSPFLRVVIDDINYHPGEQETTAIISKLLPYLKQYNILLAIENHDRFAAATLQRIICKTDPSFVKICLDTANSLGAGEGIEQVVKILGSHTVNLHIKDFNIRRVSHKMGFSIEGEPAGEGMLNIPWLIKELSIFEQCKTATLELWSNMQETMQETTERESEWAEKSITYLKTIIA